MNLVSFHAVDNSSRYEARKAFFADSKPFSIPAAPPSAAEAPSAAKTPPPASTPSEASPNSRNDYCMDNAFMQVDSQRKNEIEEEEGEAPNFLQQYVKKEEEEEEEKKDEKLLDYLIEALKGNEKELRMEGNSYMSDEEKFKYYQRHCPGLFGSPFGSSNPSNGSLGGA
jgi:hypothetical protein